MKKGKKKKLVKNGWTLNMNESLLLIFDTHDKSKGNFSKSGNKTSMFQ